MTRRSTLKGLPEESTKRRHRKSAFFLRGGVGVFRREKGL